MDLIGTSWLHYDIIEKLGEGGMGKVYKAVDNKLKRVVAIKFLTWRSNTHTGMKMRFQVEAQAVAKLNHPNIATIFAIEEVQGPDGQSEIFFAMEYVDGMELRQKIINEQIPIAEVVNIALQIGEGLQLAHEKGITHRDIKPANIMLTAKGRVKLMDFGLARIGQGIQLTQANTTLGTYAYMSPEQASGEKVDHRSDIWSFGVVLYEMLAGSLPFQKDNEYLLINSIINNDPIPLARKGEGIPQALVDIVKRILEKDLSIRYQGMQPLVQDLQLIAKGLFDGLSTDRTIYHGPSHDDSVKLSSVTQTDIISAGELEPSPLDHPVPIARRRSLPYVLAGLLLVLTTGGIFWWTSSSPDASQTASEERLLSVDSPDRPEESLDQGDTAPLDFEIAENPPGKNTQSETALGSTPPEIPSVTPIEVSSPEPTTVTPEDTTPPELPDGGSRLNTGVDTQILQRQAIQERAVMIEAKERVPGNDVFKSALSSYTSAQQGQQDGQAQFDLSNFQEAVALFNSAQLAYIAARDEALLQFKSQVDHTRILVEQAEARIRDQNPENDEYLLAVSKKNEGDQAYADDDFEGATRLYSEAQQLFTQTAERYALETERTRQVEALTNEAKLRLINGFEDQDIAKLESNVILSENDRATWLSIFSSFEDFRLNFVEEDLQELDSNHFQLELTSVLTYTNNKNEDNSIKFVLWGTMENENQTWSTLKFNMRFTSR